MSPTITVSETLVKIPCCMCGMTFAVPEDWSNKRREDHRGFYCPNGCPLAFNGKTEAEKLRDELARVKSRNEFAEARLEAAQRERDHVTKRLHGTQGALTKVKNRVAKGVCPCCNRSFADLHRHMTTKHPDFSEAK